jgi:hypothetical protein
MPCWLCVKHPRRLGSCRSPGRPIPEPLATAEPDRRGHAPASRRCEDASRRRRLHIPSACRLSHPWTWCDLPCRALGTGSHVRSRHHGIPVSDTRRLPLSHGPTRCTQAVCPEDRRGIAVYSDVQAVRRDMDLTRPQLGPMARGFRNITTIAAHQPGGCHAWVPGQQGQLCCPVRIAFRTSGAYLPTPDARQDPDEYALRTTVCEHSGRRGKRLRAEVR